MTFLTNLWHILTKAPQIIGMIKSIIDLVGSEHVQKILETIQEALQTESSLPDMRTASKPERERIVRKLLRQWIQRE